MDIFYTDKPVAGSAFVGRILQERFGIASPRFFRGEKGKPYLENGPVFFSLTHSHGRTFAAFSGQEIGLDAEWRGRPLPEAIIQRLSPAEREEDFFRVWTAKEAYIKFCGGTIAGMLPSLRFEHGVLLEHGMPVSAALTLADHDGYTLAVCAQTAQPVRPQPF